MMNDDWCAHQTVGRLHKHRWNVEDTLAEIFPRVLSVVIMQYTCDDPRLVFAIQKIYGRKRIRSIQLFIYQIGAYDAWGERCMELTFNRLNAPLVGMEAWDALFWHHILNHIGGVGYSGEHIRSWHISIDALKATIYDESHSRVTAIR